VETLVRLAPRQGAHLVLPRLGEPVQPSRAETPAMWWREVESPGNVEAAGRKALRPAPEEAIPEAAAKAIPWPLD